MDAQIQMVTSKMEDVLADRDMSKRGGATQCTRACVLLLRRANKSQSSGASQSHRPFSFAVTAHASCALYNAVTAVAATALMTAASNARH